FISDVMGKFVTNEVQSAHLKLAASGVFGPAGVQDRGAAAAKIARETKSYILREFPPSEKDSYYMSSKLHRMAALVAHKMTASGAFTLPDFEKSFGEVAGAEDAPIEQDHIDAVLNFIACIATA
ncbi:hypothetical protein, partial [Enterococcus faecalis]|uniref:hypothetical protein n=1 Tax=Enterococcus faecalis TaxID=1351 RepID=UPI001FC841E1